MWEIRADSLGLSLHATQMAGGGLDESHSHPCLGDRGARRGLGRHRLLQIGVGHLVRVELGAVAWQVKHFDLVLSAVAQAGTTRPPRRTLRCVASSQRSGHPPHRPQKRGPYSFVDLLAQRRPLAPGNARQPIACTRSSTLRGERPPIQASCTPLQAHPRTSCAAPKMRGNTRHGATSESVSPMSRDGGSIPTHDRRCGKQPADSSVRAFQRRLGRIPRNPSAGSARLLPANAKKSSPPGCLIHWANATPSSAIVFSLGRFGSSS